MVLYDTIFFFCPALSYKLKPTSTNQGELFMDFVSSLETIEFQHRSKFANAMTEVFQDVIDYRDSLEGSDRFIVKSVLAYTKSKLPNRFKKVVKTHVNLNVTKLHLSQYLDCMFAVLPNIATPDISLNTFYGYTGTILPEYTPTTAEELNKVSDTFSKELSRIGKDSVNINNYNKPINCTMFFDPNVAFLSKELIHTDLRRMTAEEIASIMMHEVGHMMSIIEHANKQYNVMEANKKALDYFNKYAPTKEKIKNNKKLLEQFKKDKKISKDITDKFTKIQKGIDELEKSKGIYEKVILKIVDLVSVSMGIIFSIYAYSFGWLIDSTLVDFIELLLSSSSKTSDKIVTSKNDYINERNADEFVSRHGYGAYLASGLDLIFQYSSLGLGFVFNQFSSTLRSNSLLRIVLSNMFVLPTDGMGVYETELKRTKRLQQNCIKAFKKINMPDSFIDEYILEYEAIVDVIKKKDTHSRGAMFVENFFYLADQTIRPKTIINMIRNGKLNNDYRKLMETIEKLNSSNLYYKAAKLSQLARR